MLVIPPITITDAILTSNSVAETVAAYNPATTYAAGDQVRSDATHRIYQSVQASNTGHALTDAAWWVDVGPTNPWAAFDYYRNTVTTDTDEITFDLTAPQRINSLIFLGLKGVTSITVIGTVDAVEVYNTTFNLNTSGGSTGWWSYFFGRRSTAEELFVTNLPPARGMVLSITLAGTGAIGVGTIGLGASMYIGDVQHGAEVSGLSYGYQAFDKFGGYEYVKGGYSLQNDYPLMIPKGLVSKVVKTMRELDGVPCFWVGAKEYGCTYNFGPVDTFRLAITYPNHSTARLAIKGLP